MSLPPYIQYFSEKSMVRATEYLDQVVITEAGERILKAKVWGSYKYKVIIKWNVYEEYTVLKCSCPYDYDGYCKHIGAVLMFAEKNPEIFESNSNSGNTEFKEISARLPDKVHNMEKNELLELIEKMINTIPGADKKIKTFI